MSHCLPFTIGNTPQGCVTTHKFLLPLVFLFSHVHKGGDSRREVIAGSAPHWVVGWCHANVRDKHRRAA